MNESFRVDRYSFKGEEQIVSPQLIYYQDIIEANIDKMIEEAGGTKRLWPHIKTHKMASVVKMLLSGGITRIKCSNVAEAEMAAIEGAEHVLLAYPLIGPIADRYIEMVQKYPGVSFYAIGDSSEQVGLLGEKAHKANICLNLLLDVDTGQHRTGVDMDRIVELYSLWNTYDGIRVRGLHCYDGHIHIADRTERMEAVRIEDTKIKAILSDLNKQGLNPDTVVSGGTPTFPGHLKYSDAFLSPGTCVIQDAGYLRAYPDMDYEPGAAILCRVISRTGKDTFTIDLGTKSIACDPGNPVCIIAGYEKTQIILHNEEHMVLKVNEEYSGQLPETGEIVYAIPVHICPTTIKYPFVASVKNGSFNGWWDVSARDRVKKYNVF